VKPFEGAINNADGLAAIYLDGVGASNVSNDTVSPREVLTVRKTEASSTVYDTTSLVPDTPLDGDVSVTCVACGCVPSSSIPEHRRGSARVVLDVCLRVSQNVGTLVDLERCGLKTVVPFGD